MIPQPIGRFDGDTGQWVLTEPWECPLSHPRKLVVWPGATSDGASIPRFLWSAVGPRYHPKTFAAALAHDMLYVAELLPRDECDREFRRLLVLTGAGYQKSSLYYMAVRWFGWAVWLRHTRESVAAARMFAEIRPA
jgi:hypothetical protein